MGSEEMPQPMAVLAASMRRGNILCDEGLDLRGNPFTDPVGWSRGVAMAKGVASGEGTKQEPWTLKTPSGSSEFVAYRDEGLEPPALVVQVGKTELRYDLRCIHDLHAMLKSRGDWVLLGSADEQKPAAEETVEAWGRSPQNPIGGWYGLKRGLRGRFGMYVPPVLEALGLAEVEHLPKNNRMKAR